MPQEQIAGIEAAVRAESITCFDDLTLLLLPRRPDRVTSCRRIRSVRQASASDR